MIKKMVGWLEFNLLNLKSKMFHIYGLACGQPRLPLNTILFLLVKFISFLKLDGVLVSKCVWCGKLHPSTT